MRQVTFEIPDELAERFDREVPPAEQSACLTGLLLRHLLGPIFPTLTDEEWEALNEFDHAADDAWLVEMRHNSPK